MAKVIHSFGQTERGDQAHLAVLSNEQGMTVATTDLGACLVSVRVPDGKGYVPDVTLGYDGVRGYEHNDADFGAIVGRCANRIAGASFELAGTTHRLAANEGANSLHSGPHLWFERMWQLVEDDKADTVTYELLSRPGDQGFPGAVDVHVSYTLTEKNELTVSYLAEPSAPTIVNLTCHAYWNLNGHAAGSVLDHTLKLDTESYTPSDEHLIPTGEILPVAGTPYDFRETRRLGDAIDEVSGGYDTNFVLSQTGQLEHAAHLVGDRSGITLDILTTSPGLQVYTSGGLNCDHGKGGRHYGRFDAVALETQFYPDAIHHKNFPQPVFGPDRPFQAKTVFSFGTSA